MNIRYRRNIDCLSENQLHDLREAYQSLYDMPDVAADSFATLGGIHGLPNPTWCDHGYPGFLTWHRAYMRAFEKALQCVNSDVMLPFWDWSSGPTTGVPAACSAPTYVNRNGDEVPNPLFSGPIATGAGGGATARRPDIATTSFAGPAASAQSALAATDFATFQTDMNGPHGWVHGLVGGQMGSVAYAGFDPIFFLHHCNVDRLWWNWQRNNLGAALPATEAAHELDPFNRPFSTDWYVGADVESTDDLGYRYLNWCLFIPPILIWEVFVVKLPQVMHRSLRSARLVLRSSHMPRDSVEFRVFANQPRASHRSKIDDNPSFVGSIGTFGMGPIKMESRSTSASFDLGINLTEHVEAALEEGADELKLKIVAVDADGAPIDAERLDVDDIELILE